MSPVGLTQKLERMLLQRQSVQEAQVCIRIPCYTAPTPTLQTVQEEEGGKVQRLWGVNPNVYGEMIMTNELLQTQVQIPVTRVVLTGDLTLPQEPKGIVLFVHGSGSSRHSSRNQYVAQVLQQNGMATFLFDLLTEREEIIDRATGHMRLDIPFLAHRLLVVTDWVRNNSATKHLKMAYFSASTDAAAAFLAAAELRIKISAVVSLGGRPDLAEAALPKITAPTLLIVGGYDVRVIELNRYAFDKLSCEKSLKIVPAASHVFEEPGKLEKVARLASDWFLEKLVS